MEKLVIGLVAAVFGLMLIVWRQFEKLKTEKSKGIERELGNVVSIAAERAKRSSAKYRNLRDSYRGSGRGDSGPGGSK
jgi:hypothetical protein